MSHYLLWTTCLFSCLSLPCLVRLWLDVALAPLVAWLGFSRLLALLVFSSLASFYTSRNKKDHKVVSTWPLCYVSPGRSLTLQWTLEEVVHPHRSCRKMSRGLRDLLCSSVSFSCYCVCFFCFPPFSDGDTLGDQLWSTTSQLRGVLNSHLVSLSLVSCLQLSM